MIDPKIRALLEQVIKLFAASPGKRTINDPYFRNMAALNHDIDAVLKEGALDTTIPTADISDIVAAINRLVAIREKELTIKQIFTGHYSPGPQWPIGRWFKIDGELYECVGYNHERIPALRDENGNIYYKGLHGAQQCDPPDKLHDRNHCCKCGKPFYELEKIVSIEGGYCCLTCLEKLESSHE